MKLTPITPSVSGKMEGGKRLRGLRRTSQPGRPLITIITVVFNAETTLGDTIRSVIQQTYGNIEYIVVDGGSRDGTLDVIRKYDNDIDYWVSEKDAGIYDGMNKGIALATGDYIGLLNADDFFSHHGVVDRICAELCSSNVDAVFSGLDIVDPANLQRVLRKYRASGYSRFMLRIGIMPAHPTFYCKRSCYEQAGPYRTDYRIAADFEMLVRLLVKYQIKSKFINEITIHMRSGGLSSSGLKASWIVNREIVRACRENGLYSNMLMLALKLPIRFLERIL